MYVSVHACFIVGHVCKCSCMFHRYKMLLLFIISGYVCLCVRVCVFEVDLYV